MNSYLKKPYHRGVERWLLAKHTFPDYEDVPVFYLVQSEKC